MTRLICLKVILLCAILACPAAALAAASPAPSPVAKASAEPSPRAEQAKIPDLVQAVLKNPALVQNDPARAREFILQSLKVYYDIRIESHLKARKLTTIPIPASFLEQRLHRFEKASDAEILRIVSDLDMARAEFEVDIGLALLNADPGLASAKGIFPPEYLVALLRLQNLEKNRESSSPSILLFRKYRAGFLIGVGLLAFLLLLLKRKSA